MRGYATTDVLRKLAEAGGQVKTYFVLASIVAGALRDGSSGEEFSAVLAAIDGTLLAMSDHTRGVRCIFCGTSARPEIIKAFSVALILPYVLTASICSDCYCCKVIGPAQMAQEASCLAVDALWHPDDIINISPGYP